MQTSLQTGPFVAATCQMPQRIKHLDALYHAMCSSHVARMASTLQGRALLLSADRAFNLPELRNLRSCQAADEFHAHFGPVFGAACGLLHIVPLTAVRLLLFSAVRQVISAGVRLGIIGSLESLPLLHTLTAQLDQAAALAIDRSPEDAAMPCPLLDLWHGSHDRLYSRLFQS